jgi:hypothetical protein
MSNGEQTQISEDACKYLNYCTKVSKMDKEEFLFHYNYEISRVKKLPSINDMSSVVSFRCINTNHGTDSQIPSPVESAPTSEISFTLQSHLGDNQTQSEQSIYPRMRKRRSKRRNIFPFRQLKVILVIVRIIIKHHLQSNSLQELELNVFYKQIPNNRSHRYPPLVYVITVLENTLRTKIFSQERLKQTDFGCRTSFKKEITFDCKKPVVINPELNQLTQVSDCNVVFTKRKQEDKCEWVTLLPIVIYLFKTESVIYKTNSYNGSILRIHYKNNVDIQLNRYYND